jgi:hypothetical protein
MSNKKIIILCITLVILILANLFRYDNLASKTTDSIVIKWYKDRWTNVDWTYIYSPTKTAKFPTNYKPPQTIVTSSDKELYIQNLKILKTANTLVYLWYILLICNILGLLYQLLRRKKEMN